MERDASLEEFLGSEADDAHSDAEADEPDTETDADDTAAGSATTGPGDESVEPATVTARWDPDGLTCEACGAVVERQWRDGDSFVCPSCKEW